MCTKVGGMVVYGAASFAYLRADSTSTSRQRAYATEATSPYARHPTYSTVQYSTTAAATKQGQRKNAPLSPRARFAMCHLRPGLIEVWPRPRVHHPLVEIRDPHAIEHPPVLEHLPQQQPEGVHVHLLVVR